VRDVPRRGSGYCTVTIAKELDKDIEKIKKSGKGYRSKSDVVEDAVRRLLSSLKETGAVQG
jgi:Arc/MetJ-type ribon-helix-helix transcriptional regulator